MAAGVVHPPMDLGDHDLTPEDEPDDRREPSDDEDVDLETSPAIGVIDPERPDPPEPSEPA